jgi:hypothetical protein
MIDRVQQRPRWMKKVYVTFLGLRGLKFSYQDLQRRIE